MVYVKLQRDHANEMEQDKVDINAALAKMQRDNANEQAQHKVVTDAAYAKPQRDHVIARQFPDLAGLARRKRRKKMKHNNNKVSFSQC